MYRISLAHRFSTVVAQATMNRPFPIRSHACPDDRFRFLVPQDMSQKTRYVACGLIRAVIACRNQTRGRLSSASPRETYRSYHDKTAKTDAIITEIKTTSFIFEMHNVPLMQTLAILLSRIKNEWLFSYIKSENFN